MHYGYLLSSNWSSIISTLTKNTFLNKRLHECFLLLNLVGVNKRGRAARFCVEIDIFFNWHIALYLVCYFFAKFVKFLICLIIFFKKPHFSKQFLLFNWLLLSKQQLPMTLLEGYPINLLFQRQIGRRRFLLNHITEVSCSFFLNCWGDYVEGEVFPQIFKIGGGVEIRSGLLNPLYN